METKNYHKTILSLQSFEMCIYTGHEIKILCSRKSCIFNATLNGRLKIKILRLNKWFYDLAFSPACSLNREY